MGEIERDMNKFYKYFAKKWSKKHLRATIILQQKIIVYIILNVFHFSYSRKKEKLVTTRNKINLDNGQIFKFCFKNLATMNLICT